MTVRPWGTDWSDASGTSRRATSLWGRPCSCILSNIPSKVLAAQADRVFDLACGSATPSLPHVAACMRCSAVHDCPPLQQPVPVVSQRRAVSGRGELTGFLARVRAGKRSSPGTWGACRLHQRPQGPRGWVHGLPGSDMDVRSGRFANYHLAAVASHRKAHCLRLRSMQREHDSSEG
jgi:hypothetical protein